MSSDSRYTSLDSRYHVPGRAWKFDQSVTDCFDDMLARSIPGLSGLREMVSLLTRVYAQKYSLCVDLGCSTGTQWAHYVDSWSRPAGFTYAGYDESGSMVTAAKKKLKGKYVESIERHDLRSGFPNDLYSVSVIWAILTLQFIPVERRRGIIENAYRSLNDGGAMIVVEKCFEHTDNPWKFIYEIYKKSKGYTDDQINKKAASLENVLVPLPSNATVEMLETAGFYTESFFQALGFRGWLAVK